MCIARQPILDRDLKIVGYELFFRDGTSNSYPDIDPHDATSRVVLEGGLTLGIGELTNGAPAFLNCSRESLVAGLPKVLPSELTVVEILENIEPDREVVEACRELRKLGYRIALDDFIYSPRLTPFLALADIIKLEMTTTSPQERKALLDRFSVQFVAEKVETEEDLQIARDEGFQLFQGYYFGRPEMMERPRREASHLFLLVGAHLCKSHADPKYVCHLIQLEPGLEHSLRNFSRVVGKDAEAPIEALFSALTPEDQHSWGRALLAAGFTQESRADDRAA